MRIFLSHSSRNKPLVREIRRYFPEHINSWIDEKSLFIGQEISSALRNAIETKTDYVVLFIDSFSIKSDWVKKEIFWALAKEKELRRVFILPIVLEKEAWHLIEPKEFQNRKYILCLDYDERSIQLLANNLISELFALLSYDFEQSSIDPTDESQLGLLDAADNLVKDLAKEIRRIVFPYRNNNPIHINDLKDNLSNNKIIQSISINQFNQLLVRLSNQDYLSGVIFNGTFLYIDEEHYSWKTQLHVESKAKVATKAMSLVKSDVIIALDAGSTTLELTKQICQGLLMKIWSGITIITNSISAANELLETSNKLGLIDSNKTLNVYISGGRVRPNTLAIISYKKDEPLNNLEHLFGNVGKADIAFIGTNGISYNKGFTTHNESEVRTKMTFIKNSKSVYILGNSAKFGIEEKITFAKFSDNITLITDDDINSDIIEECQNNLKISNEEFKIIVA